MREQARPVLSSAEGLTNQTTSFHNEGRGRFMEGNQGEVPKSSVKPEPKPTTPKQKTQTVQVGEALKSLSRTLEFQRQTEERAAKISEQRAVKRRREEAGGVKTYAQLRRPIFEDIPEPRLTDEQRQAMTEEEQRRFQTQADVLRTQREGIERAYQDGLLNPEEAYHRLNSAVELGQIDRGLSREYMRRLAEMAREQMAMRERTLGRGEDWEERIRQLQERLRNQGRPSRRTDVLKELVRDLAPDLPGAIDQAILRLIAEDEEASEMFLNKIISKPFASPEADYKLSWYADVNLQGFFTEVRALSGERFERYVRKEETALRFHQMNKTIIAESGNIDAFLNITRSVTPQHIQTASSEDGVEMVRQLIEMAYGRLYAKTNRVTGDNFDSEIMGWVTEQFRKFAEEGVVKSSFIGADGNSRNLEDWEINRAIALGRNIHSSFYRQSELIAWSNIPEEGEEWIKSMPTETVVRVLAGLKWLSHRFRPGKIRGGPEFVALIYDKIKKADYKTSLKKIGTLDIVNDLLPVRFLRGGGFDRGWRTLTCYLQNDLMRIAIPSPDTFPREVQDGVRKFLAKNQGNVASLGDFLFNQEYVAQILASEKAKIAGVELPEQFRKHDPTKQMKMIEQVMDKILDKVNLSLGVLISFSGSNESLRGKLWTKAAEFLPLRIAYFLSEEGVRRSLPGYNNVRGEGASLFNSEFETKLIKAQRLRFEAQKGSPAEKKDLENYLDLAGLTGPEKAFVRELQRFGREKAGELGKINFPHVPFLDDVPFKEANYLGIGAETFPRRMGGDFRAFSEITSALNAIITNIGQPYEEIVKNLENIVNSMQTPEDIPTGQNIAAQILHSHLQLTEQWVLSRWIPFAKTIRNLTGLPVSHMQRIFGRNAPADSETELNIKVNAALEKGIIRREVLPGDKKSQADELLEHVGAKWYNVLVDQARTMSVVILFLMLAKFSEAVVKEKT